MIHATLLYAKAPYREHFELVEPRKSIPPEVAEPFDCRRSALRDPRETRGQDYRVTTENSSCRDGGNGPCC
jgi:hypothetical protein